MPPLSLLADGASKFAQLLSLTAHGLLDVPHAPDERPRERGLIEVPVKDRGPHLRHPLRKRVEFPGARFDLRLEIFEVRPDRLGLISRRDNELVGAHASL